MKIKQKGENGIKYYSLPIGTILYRGDSDPNIGDNLILEDRITFFGFDQGNVEENYGVAYKFSTKKALKLIALDKNRETKFLDIIKERCKGDIHEYNNIKRILDINYGYLNGIRDSVSANDKTISEFICKNFTEYDGYACEQMKTVSGGTFHSESMICRPKEHLDGGERVTPVDKTESMHQEYRLRRAQPDKKKTTKSRFYKDESSHPTGRGLFDETPPPPPPSPGRGLSGMETPPPPSPGEGLSGMETPPPTDRRLFAGKRKTKKQNSKKQKSKKRKQSLRK